MIMEKQIVFISSTGRTGTQFLADSLSQMIPQCRSVHEPGTLWLSKPRLFWENLKAFGLYHMTLGQLDPKKSMYALSNLRAKGKISDEKAMEYMKGMRHSLMKSENEKIYIESSGHLFGVFDLLPKVFPGAKLIYIIRDPRNWVASALRTVEYILYGPLDWGLSVTAEDVPDNPYGDKWKDMSKFERYCWWYSYLNRFVLEKCKDNPDIRIYRFEDLFGKENRDDYFQNLLEYTVEGNQELENSIQYKPQLLTRPTHSKKTKKGYLGWKQWRSFRTQKLLTHCGEFMSGYGYGREEAWAEKIRQLDRPVWALNPPHWLRRFYRLPGMTR